jgi:hypothetical protein
LTARDSVERRERSFHDRLQVGYIVARSAQEQKCKRVSTEILLILEIRIARDEEIEFPIYRSKELAVLQSGVAGFRDGPNLMFRRKTSL